MNIDPIYLDHNATTPIAEPVLEAMLPYLRDHFGNPSSGHIYGQRANNAVDRAREQVAALLGCDADEVIFTSGGTEANNLALRGAAVKLERRHILTTVIEHPAVQKPCAYLEQRGFTVARIGVDRNGRVDLDEVRAHLPAAGLVSIMHANNETGVVQPIAEIVAAAKEHGVLVHSDAAQSVGKLPVGELGVDMLTVAGHKLYAPKGVGALYVRRGVDLQPSMLGANHERGLRAGTENVASIVGLGAACELAMADLADEAERLRFLRDSLWESLAALVPGLAVNGGGERLPNTLNVRFPGVSGPQLLAATPGVAASTGSACHAGEESASAVILAMGVGAVEALGSVRLTLGRSTTQGKVDAAAAALGAAWAARR